MLDIKLYNFYRKLIYSRMPNFIIMGAQKSGTTSLYNYLITHPQIVPALNKEVHYFDINYHKGYKWYKDQFPLFSQNKFENKITGEASPYYIFHPHAPLRIAKDAPFTKLIILLRNPIDRALSHYNHIIRADVGENLSFEDAINAEPLRLVKENQKLFKDKKYNSFEHQYFSYLSRGIYINQIKRLFSLFPKKQILIIKSEEFYESPQVILNKVINFLGISSFEFGNFEIYNKNVYKNLNPKLRKKLIEYYQPYNYQLYTFLGVNFNWDV